MVDQRTVGELDEIVLNIFSSLDANEVFKCSLVCKRWHRVAHDNSLWQNLVLNRWPSQRLVLKQVSTLALQWQKLYRYLLSFGNYSPDDMKYFIICKFGETVLDSDELRQAVFNAMEEVNKNWEKPRLFELEETSPRLFNNNMELYYDTDGLKWVFVDRRREYVDDSFTIRLNQDRMTSRQMRFIRPYQVMASCVMMYRWLVLFKYMFTEDVGLAFYRIWRFRLKHLSTGFIFETYDWKAAMSSTFSHGCPVSTKFRDDGLAILNMLSSPFFVTHPLGNTYKTCYEIPFPVYTESVFSSENVSRSSSIETLDSMKSESKAEYMPKSGDLSVTAKPFTQSSTSEILRNTLLFDNTKSETKPELLNALKSVTPSFSSDTLSSYSSKSEDQESEDNGEDYGYYCNCEYFIHRSSWEYEEQQTVQAETSAKWEVVLDHPCPTFELVFDSYEEKWLFFFAPDGAKMKYPEKLNRQLIEKSLELAKHIREDEMEKVDTLTNSDCLEGMSIPGTSTEAEQSNVGQEAMPSSLMLYRLVCLFDLASPQYKSSEDYSVWSVCVKHRLTQGTVELKDMNGWLRVFVSLTRELKLYCSDLAVMSMNQNIGFLNTSHGCPSKLKPGVLSSTSSDNHSEVSSDSEISSEDEFGSPLETFKKDTIALLQLLTNQKFAHPYGTVAGAVA